MELVFCDVPLDESLHLPILSGNVAILLTSLLYTWKDEAIRNNQHQRSTCSSGPRELLRPCG